MPDPTFEEARLVLRRGVSAPNGALISTLHCLAIEARIAELEEEVERLTAEPDGEANPVARHWYEGYHELEATNARLVALLREHEWCELVAPKPYSQCTQCLQYRKNGHAADCPMKAALEVPNG